MVGPFTKLTRSIISVLTLFAGMTYAQSDRGRITGTVTDPTGAVVPAAQVTATLVSTGVKYRGSSNEAGEFTLQSLPVGEYQVIVEHTGFKAVVRKTAPLTAGGSIRLDTKMEFGTVQQSVEVTAEGGSLQIDDAKLQNEMSRKLIDGLPTVVSGNMRSPFDIAVLTAGTNGGDQNFRVGGGQEGSFAVTLDGASSGTNRGGSTLWAAVNAPSLEAIDQFNVVTNGFKAEYGRAGGGAVTFVSKSGTNSIHGSAFDFIRNNYFDARGFFAKSVKVYRQHDFGGTIGGPVRIPKLYDGRNKTFFFVSYEGFRNRVGVDTTAIGLPPKEFYEGDLRNLVANTKLADGSYQPITVYDPASTSYDPAANLYTRSAFANNRIPVSRFDPLSTKMLGSGFGSCGRCSPPRDPDCAAGAGVTPVPGWLAGLACAVIERT